MPHQASRGRSQSQNGAQGKGSGRETERSRSEALPAQEPTPTLWGTYKSRTSLQAHSDVERRVQVTLWAGTGPTHASRYQARDREPLQHAELAEAPRENGKRRECVKSPRFGVGRCFTRAPVMAFAQQRKRPQRPAPLKPTSVEGFGGGTGTRSTPTLDAAEQFQGDLAVNPAGIGGGAVSRPTLVSPSATAIIMRLAISDLASPGFGDVPCCTNVSHAASRARYINFNVSGS